MAINIWAPEEAVRFPGVNVDRDAITMLPNGGFVVTWREATTKIGFQLYNGLGQKVGAAKFLPVGGVQQSATVLAYGGDGKFVVTWNENSTSGRAFFSQKYSFDGVEDGPKVAIADAGSSRDTIKMASNEVGTWATVFFNENKIRLLQHDLNGSPIVPALDVRTGDIASLDIANIGQSKHVVSYIVSAASVHFNIVTNGVVGTEIDAGAAVAADIVALKNAQGTPSGEFIVVADRGTTIVAQKYSTAGAKIGGEIQISPDKQNSGLDDAGVASLKDGGFAVSYIEKSTNPDGTRDNGDVFVKVVYGDGTISDSIKVNARAAIDSFARQDMVSISEMADGRIAVSWHDGQLGAGVISRTVVDARKASVTVLGTSHDDIFIGADVVGVGDTISGAAGNDLLTGASGDDTLSGGNDNDVIYGQKDADTLNGDSGNDTLLGGAGADVLNGGADTDVASYQDATAGVTINLRSLALNTGDAQGDTYQNIEGFLGSNWGDFFVGDDNANTFDGAGGSDTVSYADHPNAGITIDLAGGAGPGGDILLRIENAIGTAGNDTFYGNGEINVFTGGLGNDTYYVQNTGDFIAEAAGGGTDTVSTTASFTLSANVENLIATGGAAVTLVGNDLANSITGNGADNVINGGGGADIMNGGGGNDIYYVDNIGDVIIDTSGTDTVVISGSVSLTNFTGIENVMLSSSGAFSLDGSALDNTLTGNDAANVLNGMGGNDILIGLGGNDRLDGGDGNDRLRGGDGADALYGLAGNDTLYGGAGKDALYGGIGKDVFVFDTRPNKRTNLDKIADFVVKDDTICLDNAAFSSKIGKGTESSPRKLSKAFFKVGTKAADSNDYVIYNKSKGVLYFDSDGSGSKAMVEIATIKKNLAMTNADVWII